VAIPLFTAIARSRQPVTPQANRLYEVLTFLEARMDFAIFTISAYKGTVEGVPLLKFPMFQNLSPYPAWVFAEDSSYFCFCLTILDTRFDCYSVI
jgi:hypothetical protein